jgi:hypothetical protein
MIKKILFSLIILASVIFLVVPCQSTLELSVRVCPDQDIFFKKSS